MSGVAGKANIRISLPRTLYHAVRSPLGYQPVIGLLIPAISLILCSIRTKLFFMHELHFTALPECNEIQVVFFLADIQRHFPFLETVGFLLLPCPEVTLIFVLPTIRGDKICRRYGHRVLKRYQETRNLTFYRDGNDVALALAKKHRRKKY